MMMIVQTVLLWASIVGNLLFFNSTVNHCVAFKEIYFKRQPASIISRGWKINSVNFEGGEDSRKGNDKSGKGFGKVKIVPKPVIPTNEVAETSPTLVTKSSEPSEIIDSSLNTEDLILKTDLYKRKERIREANLVDMKRRLKDEEDLISSDPSVGAVPEIVADRMIGRIAAFFGIPVFGGLAIFVAAFFYSKKYDVVVPPTIIAYATQAPFILGLVGISYAIISSSWDPEIPGSALGIEEFKINLQRIKDGLSRTKETAELREEIEKQSQQKTKNNRRA